MNFSEIVTQQQRLLILQMLEQDAAYSHNEGVLQSGLQYMGHAISRDALRASLDWLDDVSLITVSEMPGVGKIAKITARGLDVARGLTTVTGVARPQPGA